MRAGAGNWLAAAVALLLVMGGCERPGEPPVENAAEELPRSVQSNAQVRPQPGPPRKPSGVVPSFRMVGREGGLDFERYDDMQGQRRILEVNGGGVALFDFDGDALLDVFFTNGCRLPLKLGDRQHRGALFQNLGGMRFRNVIDESLLVQFGYTHGCAVGDYDSDGFADLYVTALGRNTFWRNNGDGTFADVTDETATAVPQWSSSAAFADVNGDGHVDLYVVNYLDESDESPTLCPNAASPDGYEGCSPAIFDGVDDALLLSDGAGRFVDVTAAAGIAGLKGKGLGVVICDFDLNGSPEIYVANDGQANFLFVQRAAPSPPVATGGLPVVPQFEERALTAGVALSESGYAQASMGIAAGDYDASGTTDLFLTHFFNDSNTLYANRGGLVFEDATRASRLGATSRRSLGFGTEFLDADNNGWLDLFVANGHVDERTWMEHGEPYRMRPQMYRNEHDGTFVEVSNWSGDYFEQEWLGRGLAVGDLDRDGRLDVAVNHQLAPSLALRNETGGGGRSLTLRLVGTQSNRNGYGARVELLESEPPLVRELCGGGSFQAASAAEVHLGLGDRAHATIRIRWPSGAVESRAGLAAGAWTIIEGQAAPSRRAEGVLNR
ncbi:MAG: CRTAC1 family protein [Planctomycetes bacterium]|nr:CRTAC1 family protein [Planctomycetota bacterium]